MNEILKAIFATRGKFFTVRFVKRDGTVRQLCGRIGVKKYVKGTGTTRSVRHLIVVWDCAKENYRTVNAATVLYFRCGDTEIGG